MNNDFDQAARLACKLDGRGLYDWIQRRVRCFVRYIFHDWDDARRLPSVQGLERINDLVAELRSATNEAEASFLITEIETDAQRFRLQRLAIYANLLSIEKKHERVGICLLNLTGIKDPATLTLAIPGLPGRGMSDPLVVNFCQQDASTTLAEIEAETTSPMLLAFIPLFAGGGTPGVLTAWLHAIQKIDDPETRRNVAAYALTFAELTPAQPTWATTLERFEAMESILFNRVRRDAEVRKARAWLLRVIQNRLRTTTPDDIRIAIEGTNDMAVLERWLDIASLIEDADALRTAMRGEG